MRKKSTSWTKSTKNVLYDGLISIREAFIYLIPVVIFFNLMVLVSNAVKAATGLDFNRLEYFYAHTYLNFNIYLFPLFFMLSLSFVLAAQRKLDKIW